MATTQRNTGNMTPGARSTARTITFILIAVALLALIFGVYAQTRQNEYNAMAPAEPTTLGTPTGTYDNTTTGTVTPMTGTSQNTGPGATGVDTGAVNTTNTGDTMGDDTGTTTGVG